MKTKTLLLTLAGLATLPEMALAQVTYLSDPNDANNHALIVAPGGNIGIGTTSPKSLLDIVTGSGPFRRSSALHVGEVPDGGLYFTSFNPEDSMVSSGAENVSAEWVARSVSASHLWLEDGQVVLVSDAGLTPGTVYTPTRRLTIDPNGNVGIGTTRPRSVLHVDGEDVRFVKYNHPLVFNADAGGTGTRAEIASDIALAFASGNAEKVRIDINGNVGIGTDNPQAKLDVNGKINCTVLELTSDRNAKAGFGPVDHHAVLEQVAKLPLTTWHYTNAPGIRHMGPMAQDFHAYLRLGSDDKHIATVDADGVALASAQALYELMKEKEIRIAALEKRLADQEHAFETRIAALEKVVVQLGDAPAQRVQADSGHASCNNDN